MAFVINLYRSSVLLELFRCSPSEVTARYLWNLKDDDPPCMVTLGPDPLVCTPKSYRCASIGICRPAKVPSVGLLVSFHWLTPHE
jgi:hypothetical protein